MLDFDTEDEELYTSCCCYSRVKKKTIFRRVLSVAGVIPIVILLEAVMGLSMAYVY